VAFSTLSQALSAALTLFKHKVGYAMPRRNSAAVKERTRSRGSLKGKTITAWDSTGVAYPALVLKDTKHYFVLKGRDGHHYVATKSNTIYG
jgi:hypothetical protein